MLIIVHKGREAEVTEVGQDVYRHARAALSEAEAIEEVVSRIKAEPQGLVRIDPDNHHTYLWPRIGKADASGQFEIVQEAASPAKPDPYLVNLVPEHWPGTAVGAAG